LSVGVTERTLYPFIGKVFEEFGWRCFSEAGSDERFPDLIFEGDGAKVVSEVKIDSEIQLTKAIIDADQKARRPGTRNTVALLFPSCVRDIPLSELERNYPRLKISALVLTDWFAERKELVLKDLAEALTTSFKDWLETKKTRVSYDLVVDVARDLFGRLLVTGVRASPRSLFWIAPWILWDVLTFTKTFLRIFQA
jgi:hypothetical protein